MKEEKEKCEEQEVQQTSDILIRKSAMRFSYNDPISSRNSFLEV